MEFSVVEVLCQAVSNHFGCGHIGELDSSSGHFISDVMVLNFNVLCYGVNQGASVFDPCLSPFRGIASTTGFLLEKFSPSNCGVGEQCISTGVSFLKKSYGLLVVELEETQLVQQEAEPYCFFAARVSATYSASVEDNAIVDCLFGNQLTDSSFSMKTDPNMYLRLFLSPAQSEFEHPSISLDLHRQNRGSQTF